MSKVLHSEYQDDLVFVLDYLLDQKSYDALKQRLTQQLLKSVKVDGFREGKVPENIAIKHIDPEKMRLTIYQETIERNFNEAFEAAKELLKKDDRIALDSTVNISPETAGETEDGFKFRININLLPKVNIDPIRKITVTRPTEDDLPTRLTLEEFLEREKENLLKAINQKREEIKEKTFENLEGAITQLEDLGKQFGSVSGFEQFLTNLYTQETEFLLNDMRQKKIVEVVLEKVEDFALPESRIESEVTRISNSVQQEAERTNQDFDQILASAGIPNPKAKKAKTAAQLNDLVDSYVRNEFKLMWILRYIYETLVEEKTKPEELEQASREIQKDPAKYNVEKGLSENEYQNVAFDRLMRSKAGNILFSWVEMIDVSEEKPAKTEKTEAKIKKSEEKEEVEVEVVKEKEEKETKKAKEIPKEEKKEETKKKK